METKGITTSQIIVLGIIILGIWLSGFNAGTSSVYDVIDELTDTYVARIQTSAEEHQKSCLGNFRQLGKAYSDSLQELVIMSCPEIFEQLNDLPKNDLVE